MLQLPSVTLCAVDCVAPSLAARAMDRCLDHCVFGDAILLSDRPADTHARWIQIEPLRSIDAYNRFLLQDLANHVQTDHVLIVQWDGFVTDPNAWREDFLHYDYIGARWPWHPPGSDIGNGGFSLRSRRLLEAIKLPGFQVTAAPEDDLIGRLNRPYLEQVHQIRFAPPALADRFAYERGDPQRPTFGFHGLFNLWRHLSDQEVVETLRAASPRTLVSREAIELQLTYLQHRKYHMVRAIYELMRRSSDQPGLLSAYGKVINEPEAPRAIISLCEELAPTPLA